MEQLITNCADVYCEKGSDEHRTCVLCMEAKKLFVLNVFTAKFFEEIRGWEIVDGFIKNLVAKYPTEEVDIIIEQLRVMHEKRK